MSLLAKTILCLLVAMTPCYATVDFEGDGTATDISDEGDHLTKLNPTGINDQAPVSVVVWANPDDVTGVQRLCGYPDRFTPASGDAAWGLGINGDEMQFTTFGVKDYDTTTFTVVSGEWQFFGAMFDTPGYDVKFYHYRPSTSTLTTATITHTADANALTDGNEEVMIGAINANNAGARGVIQEFNGQVSECAVWGSELSATEMEQLYLSQVKNMPLQIDAANLQGYWILDDEVDGSTGNGDTFRDLSTNGNDLTGDDGDDNTGLTAQGETFLSYP